MNSVLIAGPDPSHSQKLAWFQNDFRPHINGWVFGPINRLVHSEDALIGFIFMACAINYLAEAWSYIMPPVIGA
jgi:hypothetical protein